MEIHHLASAEVVISLAVGIVTGFAIGAVIGERRSRVGRIGRSLRLKILSR